MRNKRVIAVLAVLLAAVIILIILPGLGRGKSSTVSPTSTEPPVEAVDNAGPTRQPYEDFDPKSFTDPTTVDNEWFPLKPGMQYTYEGVSIEDNETLPHRIIFTVTDLTKVIEGIRTVVVWDQDYIDNELVETEISLFAQDDAGTVWHFGEYPEAYEDGNLIEAPTWIHGIEEARAGITMNANPRVGDPDYAQGWGPAVDWNDRAQVVQMGQKNCVPVKCYDDVLVTEETSRSEPGAFQLKYYARGIGNIRVGWKGADTSQETLELVKLVQLSPEAMAEARTAVFKLEKSAYEISKNVYGKTQPVE